MQNNVDDEIKRVLSWSLADRIKLLENLQASISQSQQANMKRHKAREFKGACRDTWKDVNVEEYLRQAQLLSLEDEARLLEAMMADLRQRLEVPTEPRYNVLDFEGIGHETWKDVDIDEYIRQERASWDG